MVFAMNAKYDDRQMTPREMFVDDDFVITRYQRVLRL